MRLLKSLLSKSETKTPIESNIHWIPLTTLEQIDEIKELSKSENILVFKHSTRCGISSMVMKRFEKLFDASMQHLKVYYLDLLSYRDVSNEIAYEFQVIHQSPQLVIIRNQKAIFHTSHYDITSVNFKELL